MPELPVPEWLTALTQLGLVGWLVLSIAALVTRRVVTRGELDEKVADCAAQAAKAEQLRLEERTARLESDRRLDLTLQTANEQTRLLQELRVELARIAPRRASRGSDG